MVSHSSKLCPTPLVQKREVSDNTWKPGPMHMCITAYPKWGLRVRLHKPCKLRSQVLSTRLSMVSFLSPQTRVRYPWGPLEHPTVFSHTLNTIKIICPENAFLSGLRSSWKLLLWCFAYQSPHTYSSAWHSTHTYCMSSQSPTQSMAKGNWHPDMNIFIKWMYLQRYRWRHPRS